MDRLERVVKAKVRLTRLGGQGVLIPGQMILTAAHCLQFPTDGGAVLGDHLLEPIRTADERQLVVAPVVVEQMQDIAVLGTLDGQYFYEEATAFEAFCDETDAVPIAAASHSTSR